jgi:hypothetical protein
MMRKIINTITILLVLITVFVSVSQTVNANPLTTNTAQVAGDAGKIAGALVQPPDSNQGSNMLSKIFAFTSFPDLLASALAILANAAMTVASWLLIAAGYILDVSIRLTLDIKDFVDATPAIFIVWKTLRDITGLFFIFYLLFAAIQMMTGWGKGSYGTTVKNIVIAGILINFSFFIVSVAIDASNIVSQAIYRAMVPNSVDINISGSTSMSQVVQSSGKSDISNIFMNSLKIQSIYDTQGNKLGVSVGDPFKVLLIGVMGVIMMLTTAASFIFAAIAFIARLVILLFLLAFSSIWFAGMVIPQINEHVKKFSGMLYSQLIFMPAYLILMYVALTIINGSKILGTVDVSNLAGNNWAMPFIMIGVNFAIVIFILNLPLAVGLSMGGAATSIMKKGMGKWDAINVWKNVGLWSKENTGGRVASAISRSEGFKNFASKSIVGELALKGVRGVAGGYDKKLESQVKARTEFASSLGADERSILEMKRKNARRIEITLDHERRARAAGNIAMADRYKAHADDLKKQGGIDLAEKQKERQADYASRIESRSVDTLFMKVARKDKVAAAKINIDVWQKQLDKKKESVTDLKRDLRQVEIDIRREEAAGRMASPRNTDEKTRLEQKIKDATRNPSHGGNIAAMGTDDLQDMIDEAKLTK